MSISLLAHSNHNRSTERAGGGFTLVELIVCLAMLALLVCFMAPVLAGSTGSPTTKCLNNHRQLMIAMSMYTADHHGLFRPNPDDGNTVPGHNWCPGMAGAGGGAGGANEYDPDILKTKCLLSPYLGGQVDVFRCPADPRLAGSATGLSATNIAHIGKNIPAARSIAMNAAVGTGCWGFLNFTGHSGALIYPLNAAWLDNNHSHISGRPFRTYGSAANLIDPPPAKLWVLLDEMTSAINDANFAFGMNRAEWVDRVASNHDGGAVLSFADGHAERHQWVDPRTRDPRVQRISAPGSPDWEWMRDRTSARAQ